MIGPLQQGNREPAPKVASLDVGLARGNAGSYGLTGFSWQCGNGKTKKSLALIPSGLTKGSQTPARLGVRKTAQLAN